MKLRKAFLHGNSDAPCVMRVITRLNVGGPAIQATLLTKELPRLGYRALLATGACEEGEADMSYLVDDPQKVYSVASLSRSVSPIRNLVSIAVLWRLMRRFKPEIVHTHTAMAGTVGRLAAILAGVPIVVHTFHGNSLKQYFSPAVSRIFLLIEQLLGRFTDAICVIAPQQLRELCDDLKIAPKERFRLVPLGLNLSECLTLERPAPNTPLRVGWFGRFVEIKNIGLLSRIIELAAERGSGFQFHIAGDGPDACLLNDLSPRAASTVVRYGWVKDIVPVLSKCDVVIQTSLNEGTPVALIQAMAAARPFVATEVGGITDMLAGNPVMVTENARWFDNGILAEPSAEAFINVLTELETRSGQIRRMGAVGRLFAAERYEYHQLVRNIDALYRELLAERASRKTKL